MKTEKRVFYKWNGILAVLAMVVLLFTAITGHASGTEKVEIDQTAAAVSLGETLTLDLKYQMPAGKTAQLQAVSADESVAAVTVQDLGGGKAILAVTGQKLGSCVVAVFEASNPAAVDYVTVNCGFAKKGEVYTINEGSSFTTVYDDQIIRYSSLMTAKSSDRLAINHLEVERHSGMDALVVEGILWQENRGNLGLLTFYANFYDASGRLLERMPYYVKNTGAGTAVDLTWYIPEGCREIIVE